MNINGPTPLLEFEVKPPAGQSVENLADVQPELDTPRNRMPMPGYWHTDAPKDVGVRAGYVELYFRTSQRLFVLKFPGDTDRIFRLKLPANPMRAKYRAWSDWQNPDFVAKGASSLLTPLAETNIRFATRWIIRIDKLDCRFGETRCPQRFGKKTAALPPDIGAFGVSSTIGSERTGIFRTSRCTLALLRTSARFTSSAARVGC